MGLLDKCVDALEGTLEYLAKHFMLALMEN